MRRPLFIVFFLITVLAAVTPSVTAQRASYGSHFASGYSRGGHARSSFYPLAYGDPLYSDYLYSTGYPVASQPPVIVVQSAPAAAPVPEPPSSVEPLLIELQGERYVRVSGQEMSGQGMRSRAMTAIQQTPSPQKVRRREQASSGATTPEIPAKEVAAAILVFRDGHREELSDYTIANGVLYTSGEPYSGGSWNRKIELSTLNLPETIRSNQSRGVPFQLPSAANEVMVRP